jgi:hypothetical protein
MKATVVKTVDLVHVRLSQQGLLVALGDPPGTFRDWLNPFLDDGLHEAPHDGRPLASPEVSK